MQHIITTKEQVQQFVRMQALQVCVRAEFSLAQSRQDGNNRLLTPSQRPHQTNSGVGWSGEKNTKEIT